MSSDEWHAPAGQTGRARISTREELRRHCLPSHANVWGAIGMIGAALVAASVFPIAVSAGAVIGTAVVIGAAIGLATTPQL